MTSARVSNRRLPPFEIVSETEAAMACRPQLSLTFRGGLGLTLVVSGKSLKPNLARSLAAQFGH